MASASEAGIRVGEMGQPLSILGLLLGVAAPLFGQAGLSGLVREDATGRPLSGVEILVEGSDRSTVSNKSGEYSFKRVPRGFQVVLFRAVGFRAVRLQAELGEGGVTQLDAKLVPFAIRLDSLVATGESKRPRGMGREAFEERRSMGFGQFIDSQELRRSEDRQLSDLLRGHNGIVIAQNRFALSARTGCYMQILYDEQSLYSPASYLPPVPTAPATPGGATSRFTRAARPMAAPTPLDINTIQVSDLDAVEIYRSLADTPLQFGGAAAGCGTVVLWSRRGGSRTP